MNQQPMCICVIACLAIVGASTVQAEPRREIDRSPPPHEACPQDVVVHVLTENVGDWHRKVEPVAGDPTIIETLTEMDMDLLEIYDADCGAATQYVDPETMRHADVLMIAFDRRLHAIGFFTAHRGDEAEAVLLPAPAYRDERGRLHVYSGYYYLRIEGTGPLIDALPADQLLGGRLEARLPEMPPWPRLVRIIPRGWATPLNINYGPTDIFGEDAAPMALIVRRSVGRSSLVIRAIDASSSDDAERLLSLLLQHKLEIGRAWEAHELGEEAFSARDGDFSMAMRQDEFLIHVSTDAEEKDAQTALRLIGTMIRTTRPLPGVEPPPAEEALTVDDLSSDRQISPRRIELRCPLQSGLLCACAQRAAPLDPMVNRFSLACRGSQ